MDDIDIANAALTLLGEAPVVSFTQPNSAAAARVARAYPLTRDELLRSHRWNFAIRRAILSADPQPPAFGFGARFALPADLLHFIGIFDQTEPQQNYSSTRDVWRIEGRWLLYDGTEAPVFYTAKQLDASRFDPLFANALSYRLAGKLAYTTTANADMMRNLAQGYEMAIREARFANAIENAQEVAQSTAFTDSRRQGGLLISRGFPGGLS